MKLDLQSVLAAGDIDCGLAVGGDDVADSGSRGVEGTV